MFTPASGRNGAYFTLITEPIGAYIWLFFGISMALQYFEAEYLHANNSAASNANNH